MVVTVDVMGVIVKMDIRDKLIIYAGQCVTFRVASLIAIRFY